MSSTYLPLQQVIDFFGITIQQYFSLVNVPFPVITRYGRVVYLAGSGDYIRYDANDNNPNDSDITTIRDDHVSNFYIDFSIFNKDLDIADTVFRYNNCALDYNKTTINNRRIETQTKESSRDLYYDLVTGLCTNISSSFSEVTPEYPFFTLDLINDVHPWYEIIRKGTPNSGSYNASSRTINISSSPLSKGNKRMSLTDNSIIDANKQALLLATKLEVGSLALGLITEQAMKALPAPLQLLVANNPLLKIAVANLINLVVLQTGLDDDRVLAVNDAMLTVSWMETINAFDFKAVIDGALAGIPSGKIEALVKAKAESAA